MAAVCAGSSQSYANGNWTDATTAPNAEIANGALDASHEVVRPSPLALFPRLR